MYLAVLIASTLTLADAGLPNCKFGSKLEYAGNDSLWIDWYDQDSKQHGQVAYTNNYELIQIFYLG